MSMLDDDLDLDLIDLLAVDEPEPVRAHVIEAGTALKIPDPVPLVEDDELPDLPMLVTDYYKIIKRPEELLAVVDETPDDLTGEQRVFLMHYMASGVVTTALRKSGISKFKYNEMMKIENFADAVAVATEAIADALESEGLKQALTGNTKLLIKMLESTRPAKFGRTSTIQQLFQGKMEVDVHSWAELSKSAMIDVTPEPEIIDIKEDESDGD